MQITYHISLLWEVVGPCISVVHPGVVGLVSDVLE